MKNLLGNLMFLILIVAPPSLASVVTLTNASGDYCDFCEPTIFFIDSSEFSGESCPVSQTVQNKPSPMRDQKYLLDRNLTSYGLQFEGEIVLLENGSRCFLISDVHRTVDMQERVVKRKERHHPNAPTEDIWRKTLKTIADVFSESTDSDISPGLVLTEASAQFCSLCEEPIVFIESRQLSVESCALPSYVLNTKRNSGINDHYVLDFERTSKDLTISGQLISMNDNLHCFDIHEVSSNWDL